MAKELVQGVYWLGANSPDSREFHGILTPRGGSYNSYLIIDENPTIIDTVDSIFFNEVKGSICSLIDPDRVSFIVINHAEPDHTGALRELLELCRNAKVICTRKCVEFLKEEYGIDREFIFAENDIVLGKRTLRFIPDPMVHWPETMITYLSPGGLLFSSDLFGTEVSHERMFSDEMPEFSHLTRDYFAIVMRPFAANVKRAIDAVRELKLDYLLPSHGPAYRKKEIKKIIDIYYRYATAPEEEKVLIVYASIWHATEKMAGRLAEAIRKGGMDAVVRDVTRSNMVDLMAEAMTSKAILLGSLTILGSYHPSFDSFFGFLKSIAVGKPGAVFGTHGWAPSSVPKLSQRAAELKLEIVGEIDARFNQKDLKRLDDLASRILERVKK